MNIQYQLIQIALANSESKAWKIRGYEEDNSCESSCICEKENINYLQFKIK